ERKRVQRRSIRKPAILLMLLSLMMIGCNGGGSSADVKTETPAITVTVEPVATRTLKRTVTAVGTLNGFEETTLAPKVEGRILSIRTDIGDRVAPGTVLLELDPKDYDLAIGEATQALAAELAKLGLTELPVNEFDVNKVPAVLRANASLEDASR